MGVFLTTVPLLAACGAEGFDDADHLGTAMQGWGGGGTNNIDVIAFQGDPLKRSTTNGAGITSQSDGNLKRLCQPNTGNSTWCYLKSEWEDWRSADATNRNHILKGIAKCSQSSSFELRAPNSGPTFPGQWAMFPDWRSQSLVGVAARERVSACLLSLVNAANQTVSLCLIGPGAGFNDPCSDSSFNVREAGFFGDLFRESPTAYIAGPADATIPSDGRVCANDSCCDEGVPDAQCNKRLTRAGTILGIPPNYTTQRCSGGLVQAGDSENYFCTQFYSTEEEYDYNYGFTSFIEGP
jgi:hypothetical protein